LQGDIPQKRWHGTMEPHIYIYIIANYI
jgi:hypothetical protein